MKGILLFVLVFMSTAFSYDYIKQVNGSNFNFSNVACHAETESYSEPSPNKFIKINCDDGSNFTASVHYLASKNYCYIKKIDGSDTLEYSRYYDEKGGRYESIVDEYGTVISVKKVYIDCVSIYKKFKAAVVGRIRNGEFKCNARGCYMYYDDGTKIKY